MNYFKMILFLGSVTILFGCMGHDGVYKTTEELDAIRIQSLEKRAVTELECPLESITQQVLESNYEDNFGRNGRSKHLVSGCDKKVIYNVKCYSRESDAGGLATGFTLGLVAPYKYKCTVSKEAS